MRPGDNTPPPPPPDTGTWQTAMGPEGGAGSLPPRRIEPSRIRDELHIRVLSDMNTTSATNTISNRLPAAEHPFCGAGPRRAGAGRARAPPAVPAGAAAGTAGVRRPRCLWRSTAPQPSAGGGVRYLHVLPPQALHAIVRHLCCPFLSSFTCILAVVKMRFFPLLCGTYEKSCLWLVPLTEKRLQTAQTTCAAC